MQHLWKFWVEAIASNYWMTNSIILMRVPQEQEGKRKSGPHVGSQDSPSGQTQGEWTLLGFSMEAEEWLRLSPDHLPMCIWNRFVNISKLNSRIVKWVKTRQTCFSLVFNYVRNYETISYQTIRHYTTLPRYNDLADMLRGIFCSYMRSICMPQLVFII